MDKKENDSKDSKRYVWFDRAVKHMLRDKANFEVQNIREIEKLYRDHIDDMHIQQDAIDSSRAEGFAMGLAKGREQGIEQGITKGIKTTARRLLNMGMDIDTIVRATGLCKEEIDAMR